MITIYLGASFSEVKSKGYIGSFSCQSECAFNALHCFRHIPNNIIPCINVLIIFNCKLSSFCKSSAALMQTVPSSQLGAAYNQSSWYTHKRMNVRDQKKSHVLDASIRIFDCRKIKLYPCKMTCGGHKVWWNIYPYKP